MLPSAGIARDPALNARHYATSPLSPSTPRMASGTSSNTSGTGYVRDPDLDALDDLLKQAHSSLERLGKFRANEEAFAHEASGRCKHPPASRTRKQEHRSSFWHPRCAAELWEKDSEGSFGEDMSVRGGVDDGSEDEVSVSSSETVPFDIDADRLWEFLRAATGTRTGVSQTRWRSDAGHGQRQPVPGHPQGQAKSKNREAARAGRQKARARGSLKSDKVPGERGNASHRGHCGGFQFGGPDGGAVPTVGQASLSPEAAVSAALAAAKASGPDAVRQTLKNLLLQWHPDKAPQGDNPEAIAARAESTRVLRHVLEERKRLGL